MELLLLWDRAPNVASTVRQHVSALQTYSAHRVHPVSILGELPPGIELDRFDGIVIHYSLVACHDTYLAPRTRAAISRFTGVKAIFIQDEYRHVDRSVAAMQLLGINVLFTCVPAEEIDKVYPLSKLPGVTRFNVLTGYVDESLLGLQLPDIESRPIDIGYRARKLPAWLGALGQEKWRIGHRVALDAPRYGLKVDLAHREEERLYGQDWIDFMTGCKATLGVESGASVFDFSGEVQRAVDRDVETNSNLSFEELQTRHFAHLEGHIRLNQISPRCFEAAALRTLMVLYEGRYSGRLEPWRHYVPLKKDHSNFDEVVSVLRNPDRIREITGRAYDEVACAGRNSFRAMVNDFDQAIAKAGLRCDRANRTPYVPEELARLASRRSLSASWLRLRRSLFNTFYFFLFRGLLRWAGEGLRDRVHRRLMRALGTISAWKRRYFRRRDMSSMAP